MKKIAHPTSVSLIAVVVSTDGISSEGGHLLLTFPGMFDA